MKKIRNLVILLEYQNRKVFLEKGYTPNWPEEVFVIKEVKNTVPWTYVIISDLNREEIVRKFYEKELEKQIINNLELKK